MAPGMMTSNFARLQFKFRTAVVFHFKARYT